MNASLASYTNRTDGAPYACGKALLRFVCEAMRWSLAGYGVDVSVVNPGYVQTQMFMDANDPLKESFRPSSMTVEKAAGIIADGLERNLSSVDFPWTTFTLAWSLGSLHPIFRGCVGPLLLSKVAPKVLWKLEKEEESTEEAKEE